MLNGESDENSKKKTQTNNKTKQKYNMKLPELHVLWRN